MSLPLSTCFIVSRMFIITVCAPRLERILTNSISSESNYLENDNVLTSRDNFDTLRTDQNPQEKSKKNCNGYDYDETKCKKISDRIICGYNKNFGDLSNKERNIDLGNGCRIRGDRIECGYLIGPFTYLRRPPAHPDNKEFEIQPTRRSSTLTNRIIQLKMTKIDNSTVTASPSTTVGTTKPLVIITTKSTTPTTKPTTLKTNRPTTQSTTLTPMNLPNTTILQTTVKRDSATKSIVKSNNKSKSRCVEKDDRIVCYQV